MFDLKGKTAVVTGAGQGIGAAVAEALIGAGARVYVAERDPATGQAIADQLRAVGGAAKFVQTDVAVEASFKALAAEVLGAHGRCDILVNNAGIGHVGTALTTKGEDLDRLYAVNVRGMLFMCQSFLPGMIAAKRGSIINMASIAGIVAVRDRFAYSTTKFAVVGMT